MQLAARLQLTEGGPEPRVKVISPSETRWRFIDAAFEHGNMCRAFGLDPVTHRFDLPKSARLGEGRAYAGRGSRISGYVERYVDGKGWTVIGTVHIAREGERFRDLDVHDARDNFTLDQTR